MESKRFFENNGHFQEVLSKHPKLVHPTETYPRVGLTRRADIPVESGCFYFEDESIKVVSHLTEKEVEISTPYSWVTSSSSEEEGGPGAAVSSSLTAEYFESYVPARSNVQPEEIHTFSSSLYSAPAIQISLGPNHQAELPEWNSKPVEKYRVGYEYLMGDCVIPIPIQKFPAQIEIKAGHGRKGCDCFDEGSVMCVQQHVREARERLRSDLGPEKFVKLGFCDMGEDISQLWTEEEERVFHEVVYANPVSHNKNFWDHLSNVFPTRTKKEIVSYYFNVFMLRRRSVQNRSNFLEIDSDDDEWNVGYCDPSEHDDSVGDSPNVKEVKYADDLPDVNINERSCKDGMQENVVRSTTDGFETGYLMEPSHGKFWDDGFQMSPLRFNDLLSTGQMIEELFGASPNSGSMF